MHRAHDPLLSDYLYASYTNVTGTVIGSSTSVAQLNWACDAPTEEAATLFKLERACRCRPEDGWRICIRIPRMGVQMDPVSPSMNDPVRFIREHIYVLVGATAALVAVVWFEITWRLEGHA